MRRRTTTEFRERGNAGTLTQQDDGADADDDGQPRRQRVGGAAHLQASRVQGASAASLVMRVQ